METEDDIRIERLLEQPDDVMVVIIAAMPPGEMLRLARTSTEWRTRLVNLADRVLFVHPSIHEGAREEYRQTRPSLSLRDRYDYLLAAAYILTYPRVRAWRMCRILARPESVVSNTFARFCISLLLPYRDHRVMITEGVTMSTLVSRAEMESIFPNSGIHAWRPEQTTSLLVVVVLFLMRCNRNVPDIFQSNGNDLSLFLNAYASIDEILTRFVIPYLSNESIEHLQPWLLGYPHLNEYDLPLFWESQHFDQHMFFFLSRFIQEATLYDPNVSQRALRTIQNFVVPIIRRSDRADLNNSMALLRDSRFHWTLEQREYGMRLLPVLLARHAALMHVDTFLSLPLELYVRLPDVLDAILNQCILEDKDTIVHRFVRDLIAAKHYELAKLVLNHANVRLYLHERFQRTFDALRKDVLAHVQ